MTFANAPHASLDAEPNDGSIATVATKAAISTDTTSTSTYRIYCELLSRVMGQYCNQIEPAPYQPQLAQFARQCARMRSSRTVCYRAFMRPPESERWPLGTQCADLKESSSRLAPLAVYSEPPLD